MQCSLPKKAADYSWQAHRFLRLIESRLDFNLHREIYTQAGGDFVRSSPELGGIGNK
jgi:hypothetical protein